MKRFLSLNLFRNSTITLLVVGMVFAPISNTLQVQRAHAIFGVGDTVFVIEDIPHILKELVGDSIAVALARAVVQRMVESTVRWINSGFKGSPAFVTDLDGFLLNVADEVAGEFIYGTSLGALCSPFQLNIRSSLAIQHYGAGDSRNPYACTLSGIAENTSNFLEDAGEEGWARWFHVTSRPQNNQYGAYALAKADFDAQIVNARGEKLWQLDWGGGFLSFEECTEVEGGGEQCSITTPGRVIADSLNKSLGAGQDSLIQADEINEIIGALMGQLVNQALGGIGGLLGASGGGYSRDSNRPYLDRLSDDTDALEASVEKNTLVQAKTKEEQAQQIYESILSAITAAESEVDQLCSSSRTVPLLFVTAEEDALDGLDKVDTNINTLDGLVSRYNSDPDGAIDQYESLVDFGVFHTDDDIADAADLLRDVSNEATFFVNEAEQECGGSA